MYVDPARRGEGIGRLLLAEAETVLSRMGVNRALLATADAHGLYADFGFGPLEDASRWMARSYADPAPDRGVTPRPRSRWTAVRDNHGQSGSAHREADTGVLGRAGGVSPARAVAHGVRWA